MREKIEKALKLSGKYSNNTVVDFECLDENRGMYFVWTKFPEDYTMKLLLNFTTNEDGSLTLAGGIA